MLNFTAKGRDLAWETEIMAFKSKQHTNLAVWEITFCVPGSQHLCGWWSCQMMIALRPVRLICEASSPVANALLQREERSRDEGAGLLVIRTSFWDDDCLSPTHNVWNCPKSWTAAVSFPALLDGFLRCSSPERLGPGFSLFLRIYFRIRGKLLVCSYICLNLEHFWVFCCIFIVAFVVVKKLSCLLPGTLPQCSLSATAWLRAL